MWATTYVNAGQIIEVHKDEDDDHPLEQYVWSPRYVHAPILRWRDENTDGENLETLYYCNDANFNVTALVDGTSGSETFGQVVERYLYDPYGKVTFLKADWSLQEVEGHADGTASAFSNEILFTGHRLDPESGLYITLHRHYHPTLGRWMQRDPKGYVDGMGLYCYVSCCPLTILDPLGLITWDDDPEIQAAKRKFESTEYGKAKIAEITKREAETGIPAVVKKNENESSKVSYQGRAEIRKGVPEEGFVPRINVKINTMDDKPLDAKEPVTNATGDGPTDVRIGRPLDEVVSHELEHLNQELRNRDPKNPGAYDKEGDPRSDHGMLPRGMDPNSEEAQRYRDRWGNRYEEDATKASNAYKAEKRRNGEDAPDNTAYRTTPAQNKYANDTIERMKKERFEKNKNQK